MVVASPVETVPVLVAEAVDEPPAAVAEPSTEAQSSRASALLQEAVLEAGCRVPPTAPEIPVEITESGELRLVLGDRRVHGARDREEHQLRAVAGVDQGGARRCVPRRHGRACTRRSSVAGG